MTIPAGPELDRLIAEKVMGWNSIEYEAGTIWMDSDGNVEWSPLKCGGVIFSPSLKIEHAWECVEKLLSRGDDRPFDLDASRITDGHVFNCRLDGGPWVSADSASLAICLAAIEAVKGGKA